MVKNRVQLKTTISLVRGWKPFYVCNVIVVRKPQLMVTVFWNVVKLTNDDTRAALATAGFLSTMACFMYLSMAWIIVDCQGREHVVI